MKEMNRKDRLNATTLMNLRNAGAYFSLILPRELQRLNESIMISKMKIPTLVSSIEVLFIIIVVPRNNPKTDPNSVTKIGNQILDHHFKSQPFLEVKFLPWFFS